MLAYIRPIGWEHLRTGGSGVSREGMSPEKEVEAS
jgi:hypothetical protein